MIKFGHSVFIYYLCSVKKQIKFLYQWKVCLYMICQKQDSGVLRGPTLCRSLLIGTQAFLRKIIISYLF